MRKVKIGIAVLAASIAASTAWGEAARDDANTERTTAATKLDHKQRSEHMANVNELVVSYLAAWNERDASRRRDLIAKTWTEGGTYIDAHRRGIGHDGIDAVIKAAQEMFPAYRLHLVSGIEAQNSYVRFSWGAGGSPEAPLYLGGTDFAIVAKDGRLEAVAGFTDAAPAR